MKSVSEAEPFLQMALDEHQELHHQVDEINHMFRSPPAEITADKLRALQARMLTLRNNVNKHFRQEEEGGYLEEAICRAPSIAPKADLLQKQHAELLVLIDRVIAAPHVVDAPADVWYKLEREFVAFGKRLLAHERAENALLAKAFNVDLSAMQ
jgi:hypothetical protein